MESVWDKIGAIIAALITALGGFYMYDRKITNERLAKVEADLAQTRTDVQVVETKFEELKSDILEIKESQKAIINLLIKRRK